MSEFRFRILGNSEDLANRWRDRIHADSGHSGGSNGPLRQWKALKRSTRLGISMAVGFGLVYYASAGPSLDDIHGRRVLVLLDESASMDNTGDATKRQLDALAAHNISVTAPVGTPGYAIRSADGTLSMLQPLQAALADNPNVDTVYFISDFKGGDEGANDAAGYAQLRRLLATRGLTLLFCTVDQRPPISQYYQITRDSGGGVIEEFKSTQ